MRMLLAIFLITLTVAACSGTPPPPPPEDPTLENSRKLARAALEAGSYAQAQALYDETRARIEREIEEMTR